jgi:hypothetical protein
MVLTVESDREELGKEKSHLWQFLEIFSLDLGRLSTDINAVQSPYPEVSLLLHQPWHQEARDRH